jgi:hypothetical protein
LKARVSRARAGSFLYSTVNQESEFWLGSVKPLLDAGPRCIVLQTPAELVNNIRYE